MNARSDTKVTVCANRNATLTVLKDAHGSILADTLLRKPPLWRHKGEASLSPQMVAPP